MKYILIYIILCLPVILSAKAPNDSILAVLNMELDRSQTYYTAKGKRIENLSQQLANQTDKEERLSVVNQLFDEYFTWQYDSAFVYVHLSEQLATELGYEPLRIRAQLNLLRCFISSGYYKEGFELIENINPETMPTALKGEFYKLAMEYYDALLIYYDKEYYTNIYRPIALEYFEKAKPYFKPGTPEYAELEAYGYRFTDASVKEKIDKYHDMLARYTYPESKLASIYILMSEKYTEDGNNEKAIYYAALSAICDIRTAIRQTTSKQILGNRLYEDGKVMFASKCIRSGLDDANFYNARQRMAQLNTILPIVEYDKVSIIEQQKDTLRWYLLLMGLLVIALIAALFTIYKQIKKLRKARSSIQQQYVEISKINRQLEITNTKLENTNEQLTETVTQLEESNEIKDMYIAQSLYGKSEYIDKIESLIKKVERKAATRQYDDLKTLYKDFNTKAERENMYSSFDHTFLMLFPKFIEAYNKLFAQQDQITIDEKGNLNTELRIYALMRLGITDNEKIARFLNLTIKTLYAYKSKIKAKTIVPKEEFEHRIISIKRM